ncbi:hypothetical protein PR202_ga26493 [Eleusine coracana subsp. coracana]|uniref:Erythronate-4-phosphate dehydrogenase family protein n=1 Tax=Eleusine coracana subsp. coracana TaxID=191504 RepID=A0AAV5DE74_ELECO|nr:hypothetical protein QOZ80_3AG0239850 [Eleusine coracana subsp. coracana]GJN08557.1 hypothetical protein PR202_ga26493 [Eleusine coracana subsp. coracana]
MAIPDQSSCLTLRVFYLRLSRCVVDESMLNTLTVTHIPLTPDTVLEVSGADHQQKQQQPTSIISNDKRGVTCSLRLDRVDLKLEEATFVSTATIRVSGSVRFEVQNGDERLLVGILETCDVEERLLGGDYLAVTEKASGGGGEKSRRRSWVMKCQVATQRGSGFLRCGREAKAPPTVEAYVAGVFRGTPIVFTKAMLLRFRSRRRVKAFMDPIPECAEQPDEEDAKETATALEHADAEESEYRCYKPDPDEDDSLYSMASAGRGDDDYSELSWFTAGVRVGVGIRLGICLGVGIGAGLLARSYQSTSRTLTRRLISKLL